MIHKATPGLYPLQISSRLGFKLSDGDPKGVVSRSRNASKLVMPTTFFMLEAIVKDPMTALEKKLISMNTRTGQGFTALSTFANHQETVSISVFSTVLTVQEEIIQSEVAAVNDEVDEGSMPWRFFKFTEPSMHGKVESVLRKNCLKPLTEPLWFRQAEPAVLVSFWTTEGQSQSFALSQFCFKQKPADSWPVDVAVSPVAACWTAPGSMEHLAADKVISVRATIIVTASRKVEQSQMSVQYQRLEIQTAPRVLESKLDLAKHEHLVLEQILSFCSK